MNRSNTAFVILSLLMGLVISLNPELNTFLFHQINSAYPNQTFWLIFTVMGDGVFVGCAFYVVFRRRYEVLAMGLLGGLLTHLTTNILKVVFTVVRPEHVLPVDSLILLGPSIEKSSYSMPSGHAMAIFMAIGLLSKVLKPNSLVIAALLLLAVMVALSRIAVGTHWPADCFVGAGLGLAIGFLVSQLKLRLQKFWHKTLLIITYGCFPAFGLIMSLTYYPLYPLPSIFLGLISFISAVILLIDLANIALKNIEPT